MATDIDTPQSPAERHLTPADFEVLEFERGWWKYQGAREATVRERFGHSLTRHTQRVLALIDHPQAHAYDPHLVSKLRARRDHNTNRRRQEAIQIKEANR